jgi:RNA polymerase sigma-70 factor (ECF subfamily)
MEARVAGSSGREITDPDTDLVQRVGRGDESACALLLERHLPRITAVAYRVLSNRADAEDVAQEVFLKVWLHASQWNPGAARFSTWMHTVAVNLCRDRLRKRRESGLEDVGEVPDHHHSAESAVHHAHVSKVVDQALLALPERQRLAIILCHYQGLSNIETAQVMGASIEAVESLLSRARRNLKTQLQGQIADLRGEP